MLRVSILHRYIFGRIALYVAIAAGAMSVGIVMIDFVEQLRGLAGIAGSAAGTALQFTFMRLPGILEQTLPLALIVGAITTFVQLGRRSEITALRAAGVSPWSFMAPVVAFAVALALAVVVLIGPVAARLNAAYEQRKETLVRAPQPVADGAESLVWLAVRGTAANVLMSGLSQGPEKLTNVSVFEFNGLNSGFQRRIEADEAVRRPSGWILTGAVELKTGAEPIALGRYTLSTVATANGPSAAALPRDLAVWQLPAAAANARQTGASPERFWLRFHRLMALPFTFAAIAMLSAVLSMGVERLGGQAKMIGIAAGSALAANFSLDLVASLSTAGLTPSWAAAWCPAVVALLLAAGTVSYKEEG